MIIAGEASGDLHGAHLLKAMKKKDDAIFFCGIGGKKMQAEGLQAFIDTESLAVMGVTEVFENLYSILRSMNTIKTAIKQLRPELLILIDYPGFNLHMAGFAKKNQIPVLYYISPKVWAWRKGRVKKIEKYVDHLALILPFEVDFYKNYQVKTSFVGNPLLDYTPDMPTTMSITKTDTLAVGLLPGSRRNEISRLFPVMLQAAEAIQKRLDKKVTFLISVAPSADEDSMKQMFAGQALTGDFEFVKGDVRNVFDRVKLVIAASGTVTLEAAIHCIPMVIIYKMSTVSYLLGRAFVKLNHVGLASIIAGEEVAPELLQGDAEPGKIAETVCRFLEDDALYQQAREKLFDIRKRLGGPGASERTAEIALNMIQNNTAR